MFKIIHITDVEIIKAEFLKHKKGYFNYFLEEKLNLLI